MGFVPTLDCVQARLRWQEDSGIVAENIFYCATASVPVATDLTEIGDAFGAWLSESAQLMVTPNWSAVGVYLRAMNEEEGISEFFTTGFPYVGTNDGVPTPLQVSYTVTWGTGLVGRSARGRTYGVGLPTDAIANHNRMAAITQAGWTERWANLMTILSAAGHSMQVVSFVDAGVPRSAGRKLPVLTANVRFPLATQRGRLS